MSVEAITWALKQPVKHSSAKFVLVALANCSDSVERLAWPSIAYLCEATSQDRKTVMANLKRLVDSGFIEDSGDRKGTTKSVVVYRLSNTKIGTPKQSQKRDAMRDEAVPFFPVSSTVFPHKQSRFSLEAVPKTGHGTVRNHQGTVIEPKKERKGAALCVDVSILVNAGFDDSTAQEFIDYKSRMKAPLTVRAWKDHLAESVKAGWTPIAAAEKVMARTWKGFEAKYVASEPKPQQRKHSGFENKNYREGVEADGTFA